MQQLNRYGFISDYLRANNQNLPQLVFTGAGWPYDDEDEENTALTKPSREFIDFIRSDFDALPPHRKVVTVFLHNMHSQVFLPALMLAKNKCSPSEFANAVLTATIGNTFIYGGEPESYKSEFAEFKKDASVALAYIRAFEEGDAALAEVQEHIGNGEGAHCEFKSLKRRHEKTKQICGSSH